MRHRLFTYSFLLTWTLLSSFYCYSQQVISSTKYSEVLFTDISILKNGEQDFSLLDKIIDLTDATPKGEEITICIFKFSYKKITDALIRAKQRGVAVRIILNKGSTSDQDNEKNKERLKEHFDDFYFIKNDISKKGIIHNKFILFSRIKMDGYFYNNIVLQTSSNFQKKSAEKLQDMVIFSDKEIYLSYMKYWDQILEFGKAEKLDKYDYFNAENELKTVKVYFYPKRRDDQKHGKDDIKKILKSVQDPQSATIKVAHGKWDDERLDILDELKELQSSGASIQLVMNKNVNGNALKELKNLGDAVIILNKSINLHTKFLIIEDSSSRVVITGSHNMTERSLRDNFEVLISLQDEQLYDAYAGYFKQIVSLED